MKFGKKLQDTVEAANKEWRPYFIDYKGLKKLISSILVQDKFEEHTTDEDEQPFPLQEEQSDNSGEHQGGRCDSETTVVVTLKRKLKTDEESNGNKKLRIAIRSFLYSFFTTLKQELDKVNDFYLDKEEELIISHHMLNAAVKDCVSKGKSSRQNV